MASTSLRGPGTGLLGPRDPRGRGRGYPGADSLAQGAASTLRDREGRGKPRRSRTSGPRKRRPRAGRRSRSTGRPALEGLPRGRRARRSRPRDDRGDPGFHGPAMAVLALRRGTESLDPAGQGEVDAPHARPSWGTLDVKEMVAFVRAFGAAGNRSWRRSRPPPPATRRDPRNRHSRRHRQKWT